MTAGPAPAEPSRQCQFSRAYSGPMRIPRVTASHPGMSARLDAVGCTERETRPIPFGHHVYVVSDLSLSPATDPNSRPVRELVTLLGDIDDAAVVVVAGNLFHPEPTSDLVKFVDATLAALPALRDQIVAFTATASHRFIVLPGSDDTELHHNESARERLELLGIGIAS